MDRRGGEFQAVVESIAGGSPAGDPPPCIDRDLDDPALYLNRELSFLEFDQRVLEEAEDPTNPLLERVKFLAITASNLAEFFMVRVAGLKQQVESGVSDVSADGLTPSEQLQRIRPVALAIMSRARECVRALIKGLAEQGVHVMDYEALAPGQRAWVDEYYARMIFPVLTPLGFDPGRPFPHISNMSLNLAAVVSTGEGEPRFARVKIPDTLPRLVRVPAEKEGVHGTDRPDDQYFVWMEQLVAANLGGLFPGFEVIETHPFRVVRDAEMVIQELEAEDLLETIERSVRQRRFGSVVRLAVDRDMPEYVRDILIENLEIAPEDVYIVDPPLATSGLIALYDLDRPDLKYPPFVPGTPAPLAEDEERDIFSAIRRQDILLHHPFDSFSPVVDFLTRASTDPHVLAIKQTLYRVGSRSPVVAALLDAARRGKQVAVLVELKARFDEESNIEWARQLEAEGVHVVYGLVGLKTHSKMAMVVRREGDQVRRYLHLATGNYNAVTAQSYTDIGLFTCDEELGVEAGDVFNLLTGYSSKQDYQRLLVAPTNMRARLVELIEQEIEHARAGRPAHLIFKLNAVVDQRMIKLLYQASQAGVQVDLLARGICCLRPGIEGVSERIRVISIVGRFLEHSRIFYFYNDGDERVLLGSADLMPRNLNRRVEVLFPVEERRLVRHLRDEVLAVYLADTARARLMQPDGTYIRVRPAEGEPPLDSQEWLVNARAGGRSGAEGAAVDEGDGATAPMPSVGPGMPVDRGRSRRPPDGEKG